MALSGIALWRKISIFNPELPFCTLFQGPSGIRIKHFDPQRSSRWLRGINFATSGPNCHSPTAQQAPSGSNFSIPEPVALSGIALWRKISIFNPELPFCTLFQGPSGIRIKHFDPQCSSRWPRGINFATSEPNCHSPTAQQAPSGSKSRVPEPVAISGIALWRKISIFNPELPFCTLFQGPSGIRIKHFDPQCSSRWPRGINFATSGPNCHSPTAQQAPSGSNFSIPEPVALSGIALWRKISIFNPELPSCTPL